MNKKSFNTWPPFPSRYFKEIFSMNMFEFRLQFHWRLFLRFQLTINKHWFRWWFGVVQATSHYLNQCCHSSSTHNASLGLNELMMPYHVLEKTGRHIFIHRLCILPPFQRHNNDLSPNSTRLMFLRIYDCEYCFSYLSLSDVILSLVSLLLLTAFTIRLCHSFLMLINNWKKVITTP